MNICPITYSTCGENRYSEEGLRLLASGLKTLKDLEYTAEETTQPVHSAHFYVPFSSFIVSLLNAGFSSTFLVFTPI